MKKLLSILVALAIATFAPLAAGSGVSSPNTYNPASVAITGGTIAGTTITGKNGEIIYSKTAPVIASGFGTGARIVGSSPTAFLIYLGTGGTASTGSITLPATPNFWICIPSFMEGDINMRTVAGNSPTSTTVGFQNYSISTGLTIAWTSGSTLQVMCSGT